MAQRSFALRAFRGRLRQTVVHLDRSAANSRCQERETTRIRRTTTGNRETGYSTERLQNSVRKPTTGTLFVGRTKRVWFWLIAGVALALILIGAFWLDPVVRNWIVEHPNRQLRTVMAQISRFGDWPEHVILGLLLLLIAWWRRKKKWTRLFLAMLIACAI